MPPTIESLEKFFKLKPRNYTTVNLEQLSAFILKNLKNHEPLVSILSEAHLKILETSMRVKYGSINFMDEDAGGNGLIVPTFSEPTMRRLVFGIDKCYYGNNIEDLATGGNGLIIPTFMEIMHMVIFWIRDNEYKELVNSADKAFFHEYFWCFEEYSKLIVEAQLKRSA